MSILKTKHPCKGQCTTERGSEICGGCFRTKEEVRDWNSYSPARKAQIILRLPNGKDDNPEKIRMVGPSFGQEDGVWI